MDQALIDLRRKMQQQIEDRDLSMLFQIELDDDEIELIRANGRAMYKDAISGWSRCDLQFAYYLVDIGKRYYDDRRYWEQFWNSIGYEHYANKQAAVGNYFMETLEYHGLLRLELGGKKYVGNILAHGFIPDKYSSAFFNFLYSFYNVALRGTVPDDLDDAMYVIAQVFSDPGFAQTYPELRGTNLIKSTCKVLRDETLFGDIVKKMIRRIGNSYESLEDVRLGAYEGQFRHWAENHDRRKARDRIGAAPYIECDKEKMRFNLIVPPRSIEIQNPVLSLRSSDGRTMCERRLHTTERFGLSIMDEEQSLQLHDPLDEFTVWIGHTRIFSNTNDGYVLFNKNGRSHRKVSPGFNLVATRGNMVEGVETVEYGSVGEDAKLYGFMMGATNSIQLGGRRFTIEKTIDESIRIATPVVNAQCRDQDGNSYMLFDKLPTLHIFVNHENRDSSLSVACGMNRIQIQRLESLRGEGFGDGKEIELDTAALGLSAEAGVYTIMLDRVVKARFLMIPGFECSFEEQVYTSQKKSTFTVTGFSEIYHFDTMDGQVYAGPMAIDGREFTFCFQVPSDRYRIDEQPWKMFGAEMYYRDACGSKLSIYSPTPLFPRIKVDGFSKSFELGVEGSCLIFDFSKIAQLSEIMKASRTKMPVLELRCGKRSLFKIRYTADYTVSEGIIVRKNAPINTWATVENMESGEETTFKGEQYAITSRGNDLKVWEYYDDGFGVDKREALFLKRRLDVSNHLEAAVISGEYIGKIHFVPGRISFDIAYFKSLISLQGEYDPDTDMEAFNRTDPSVYDVWDYSRAYNAVRRALSKDTNANRLRTRITRFSSSDPELAIQLCDAYLKKLPSKEIEEIKNELEAQRSEY